MAWIDFGPTLKMRTQDGRLDVFWAIGRPTVIVTRRKGGEFAVADVVWQAAYMRNGQPMPVILSGRWRSFEQAYAALELAVAA